MGVKVTNVGDIRIVLLTRRKGQSVHDSDKFATEEFRNSRGELDVEAYKEAICHYIDVQLEDEEVNGDDDES